MYGDRTPVGSNLEADSNSDGNVPHGIRVQGNDAEVILGRLANHSGRTVHLSRCTNGDRTKDPLVGHGGGIRPLWKHDDHDGEFDAEDVPGSSKS